MKQVISTLKGHDDKVRVVLNKSDQVDQQQLMRVYGALMWSLGKVFRSPEVGRAACAQSRGRTRERTMPSWHACRGKGLLPRCLAICHRHLLHACGHWQAPVLSTLKPEQAHVNQYRRSMPATAGHVRSCSPMLAPRPPADGPGTRVARPVQVCRVYIGSFNGVKPIREDINPQCKPLFEKEQADLLADLHEIPVRSCDRKARRAVHAPGLCSLRLDGQAHCRGIPLALSQYMLHTTCTSAFA